MQIYVSKKIRIGFFDWKDWQTGNFLRFTFQVKIGRQTVINPKTTVPAFHFIIGKDRQVVKN